MIVDTSALLTFFDTDEPDHRAVSAVLGEEQSHVGFHEEEGEFAWWDSGLRTLECSKRMMALELYASLAEHGQGFFADYVSRMFDLARWFAHEIDAAPASWQRSRRRTSSASE